VGWGGIERENGTGGELAQKMYTHCNIKYKMVKQKKEKKWMDRTTEKDNRDCYYSPSVQLFFRAD
jgi:hypothetical protein